jgi:hypothetical protein
MRVLVVFTPDFILVLIIGLVGLMMTWPVLVSDWLLQC